MKYIKYPGPPDGAFFDRIDARESDYLYVSGSRIPGAGNGLFTAIPIWKHEIISRFRGKLLSQEEADQRAKAGQNQYFISMPDGSIMDSMNSKCFARYANDAEGRIKTGSGLNSVITLDDENHVCLVAIRDINAGEEIFCSYGKRYWRKSAGFKT
jgi:uncharacterized protein